MTIPAVSTFEDVTNGVRRPSIADVGGALFEDHATRPPPQDGKHLYAAQGNQWQHLIVACARMIALARLTVDFDGGGIAFIDRFDCPSGIVVPTDFSLVPVATGKTAIQWVTSKLPPINTDPHVVVNHLSDSNGVVKIGGTPTPPAGSSQLEVWTYTSSVLANKRFTVTIF